MILKMFQGENKTITKDNVEYYQLYIACPICSREGRSSVPAYWHHNNCGGKMYIGDNGYYYCEKCGYTAPIIECGYICADCKKCGHEKVVIHDKLKHVGEAFAILGMIASTGAGLKWLARLTNVIMQQCED